MYMWTDKGQRHDYGLGRPQVGGPKFWGIFGVPKRRNVFASFPALRRVTKGNKTGACKR